MLVLYSAGRCDGDEEGRGRERIIFVVNYCDRPFTKVRDLVSISRKIASQAWRPDEGLRRKSRALHRSYLWEKRGAKCHGFTEILRYLKHIYHAIAVPRDVLSRVHTPGILSPWVSQFLCSPLQYVCAQLLLDPSPVFDRVCLPKRNSRLEYAPLGIISDMLSLSQHSPKFDLDCNSVSLLAVFEYL